MHRRSSPSFTRPIATLALLTLGACGGSGATSAPAAEPAPIVIAAADAGTSPHAARAPSVIAAQTFQHRAPAVGDHARIRSHTLSHYPRPDGLVEGEYKASDYEVNVKRVDADAVIEAFVVFHTDELGSWMSANDDFNHTDGKPTVLAGVRLTVRADPSSTAHPLAVQMESAMAAPQEAEQRALDKISDIGMRAALDAAIPDRVLSPGDRVDALAPALVRVLQPRTWHFETGGALLRALDDDEGIFDVTFQVKTESGYAIDLKGAVAVRRTDRVPTHVALNGTFEGKDAFKGNLTYERIVE